VADILAGQRHALAGIDVLRKVCNHPDLLQRSQAQGSTTYGDPAR
jgi:DNA excision repair protein ERCC-6